PGAPRAARRPRRSAAGSRRAGLQTLSGPLRSAWCSSGPLHRLIPLTASRQDEVVSMDDLFGSPDAQHAGDLRRADPHDADHLSAGITGDPPRDLVSAGVPDVDRLTGFKCPL